MTEQTDNFGDYIKYRRLEMKLTQEEVAEKVEKSASMIGKIERGEALPSVETLARLIDVLNLDPERVFLNKIPDGDGIALVNSLFSKLNPTKKAFAIKLLVALCEMDKEECENAASDSDLR